MVSPSLINLGSQNSVTKKCSFPHPDISGAGKGEDVEPAHTFSKYGHHVKI
jgi:hypothetical protein